MFRIWKFNVASKAYWGHAPRIKYKQSNNNASFEKYNQRENEEIIETFISFEYNHKSSRGHSKAKQNYDKRICSDYYNFCDNNLILKAGAIGAIHYLINHWDSVREDYFCPVQNIKILTKYFVDHVLLSAKSINGLKITFNVLPNQSGPASRRPSTNALNIKKITSLVNIPDLIDTLENDTKSNEPRCKQRKSIQKLTTNETHTHLNIKVEDQSMDTLKTKNEEKLKIEKNFDVLSNILTNLINCELDNITAIELADKGNYKESIRIWESILKKNPNFVKAIFNLAICYQEGHGVTKNLAEACNLYEAAAALGHIASHYNLAVILLRESSTSNAEDAKNRAVRLLTFAAQKGLANASEALIRLSLQVDENLQTLSNMPKNPDIQSKKKKVPTATLR